MARRRATIAMTDTASRPGTADHLTAGLGADVVQEPAGTYRRPIVACGRYDAEQVARLRAAAGPYELVVGAASERPDAVAVIDVHSPLDLGLFDDLRWVHSSAAGPDTLLTEEFVASEIVLTSAAGNGAVPLAEHALMLMLMLQSRARLWLQAQDRHEWDRHTHPEIAGTTVGIVGLGNVGRDLARKASACHMTVLGLVRRPRTSPVPYVDELFTNDQVGELCARSDFLVVTAPLTPTSRGLVGREAIARLRPGSFVVNISRGGIIDEEALVDALRSGRIAGAGLDAHATEPLPPDHPWWAMPNVLVTPHNGATTPGTLRRGFEIMLANLARFVAGTPMTNVVDKAEGYAL